MLLLLGWNFRVFHPKLYFFSKVGERIPKKAVQAIISQYDTSGEGVISFPDFVAMIYGIQTGTLNTSNQFLRAFFLQRASHEAVVEMLRTSSTNLSELVIHSDLPRGQDIRIYDALRSNTRLTSLRITSCGLQHFHASLLAAGLLENTALDTLDLASNPLGDEGFSPLAETLRMTPDARDAWEQVSGWVSNAPTPRLQMRSVFDLRDQSVVFAIVRVLELSVVFACSDSETRFQSVLPFACRASDVNVWRTESSSLHFQIC